MDDPKLIITYGGNWEGNVYKNGISEMLFVPKNLTYENLLVIVNEIVDFDSVSSKLDLRVLLNTECKITRFKIKNDRDLQYVLNSGNGLYEVFCTVESSSSRAYGSFVQLMTSQFPPGYQIPPTCQFAPTTASASTSQFVPTNAIAVASQFATVETERLPSIDLNRVVNEVDDEINYSKGKGVDFDEDEAYEDQYEEDNDDDDDDDEDIPLYDSAPDFGVDNDSVPDIGAGNTSVGDADVEAHPFEQGVRKDWVIRGSSSLSFETDSTKMSSTNNQLIYEGAMFGSKEELKTSLGMLALKEKFGYRIRRSSKTRFEASCTEDGCAFQIRAVGINEGSFWTVNKCVKTHSCQVDLLNHRPRQISTNIITSLIAPKLGHDGPIIRPKDVIGEIRVDHGIDILYSKAWRAKQRAENLIYGDPLQSFQMLPSYLKMLEKENPGTVSKLETDSENRFEYLFFALGPCINGFRYCRPVIVIDGTHLKGKFRGVMFVATTKDANEQIYPLAFGFGDLENDRSWKWFLTEVRNVVGAPSDLVIVSDAHISIGNAIRDVFPFASHCLCTYHLKQNLKKFKNENTLNIFDNACRAYRQPDFDKLMEELSKIHPNAFRYLMDADPRKWSRAYCPVRRFEFMTSNIAENLNSCLRHARKLPICTLVEIVRDMLQRWFYDRRNAAARCETVLTEWATAHVKKSMEDAEYMSVNPIDNLCYQVKDGQKDRVVNLTTRSCTCQRFDLDLLPCAHAAAAIRYLFLI